MATAAEQTFYAAVVKAEGIRQVARAAAFATYGFVAANLAAYLTALESADNTYMASVNSAASTLGAGGYTIPNTGGTNPGNASPGAVGFNVMSGIQGGGLSTMGAIG